jgi:CheY-like chemotaxis protein
VTVDVAGLCEAGSLGRRDAAGLTAAGHTSRHLFRLYRFAETERPFVTSMKEGKMVASGRTACSTCRPAGVGVEEIVMPKARIVVVEDEPAIRRGVSDALRLSGYDVTEACDGAVGYREAASGGIDLVLLDIMLPKRDGLDVLSELRRTCPTRPVILLTARGSEDDRVKGLKMGPTTTWSSRSRPRNCSPAWRRSCGGR